MGLDALVGRDAEVRLLHGLVSDLVAGRGRSVWVEGEPGIGKSTLLAAALDEAGQAGCQVYQAAASELNQRFPLWALLECLEVGPRATDPTRAEIARLLRGEGAAGETT